MNKLSILSVLSVSATFSAILSVTLQVGCGSDAATPDTGAGFRDAGRGVAEEAGVSPSDVPGDATGQVPDAMVGHSSDGVPDAVVDRASDRMPDAVIDHASDRQAPDDDVGGAPPDSVRALEAGRADTAADTRAADGAPDVAAADAGCTGWTTLARISPAAAVDLMAAIDPIVINVHVPYEGDIPGTDTSIPYDDVDALDTYLRQDHCAEILLVCKSGGMSKSAGDQLIKRGYLRVRDLAGGMQAWTAAGYPLLKDGGT